MEAEGDHLHIPHLVTAADLVGETAEERAATAVEATAVAIAVGEAAEAATVVEALPLQAAEDSVVVEAAAVTELSSRQVLLYWRCG